MSYGVIYRHEFTDEYDRRKRADVLKKDYTGSITEKVGATFSPLSIYIQSQGDDKFSTIKPTEIELKIFSDNFEFEAISEAGDKDYQIRVYEAPTENGDLTLKHIGYVIPEIYSEAYVVEPYPVSIRAASMGILNAEKYLNDAGAFYTGTTDIMTVITRCLNKLDYGIDIWDSTNTFEDRQSNTDLSPLKTIKVDQEAFIIEKNGREQALNCMEVLERILKPFVINFFMDFGRWVIVPMELRATQRFVRIYDFEGTFKETGNYNPLAQTFNWLNQDQNLEFMPIVKDVESVFEHGEPRNIVDNHTFNDTFNERVDGNGTIRWPGEWDLSASVDFQADIFQSGIRDMIAPSESAGPKATFMNSDLISDGAYIEHTGTESIQSIDSNTLRFKLLYAGQSFVRNLAGDEPDPEITIEHKVQVKIGTYYLKSDGTWTTTATDIAITDLGDGVSGYDANPLIFGDKRGASQFIEFTIASQEIPETGTARVRIYKPISENEGASLGNTFATVAYSMFSVELYPEGLPPEEATTFYSERDVSSFAEEVSFDVKFGDGPTNLHRASYLIESGGNDLVTESWTRGEFTGGIEDVYINAIFLEYLTKSNLIQGTQKIKGLFDRWFIDYGKGYTVLSGSYDERMCTFNGEMVEILNSEADVWGDALEAPENFEVAINEDTTGDLFDSKLILTSRTGDGDVNVILMDVTFNYTAPATLSSSSVVYSKGVLEDYGFSIRIANTGNRIPYILHNSNYFVYLSGPASDPGYTYLLLDSNFNLIASKDVDLTEWTDPVNRNIVSTDLFDNIYVWEMYDEGDVGDTFARVSKYNSSLVKQWDSVGRITNAFNAKISVGASNTFISTGLGSILSFSNIDGSLNGEVSATRVHSICLLPNDQLLVIDSNASSTIASQTYTIYDSDLNVVVSKAGDTITNPQEVDDNTAYTFSTWVSENIIAVKNNSPATLLFLNINTWEYEDVVTHGSGTGLGDKYTFTNDDKLIVSATGTGEFVEIFDLLARTRLTTSGGINITANVADNDESWHVGKYTNWQLYEFGVTTGTPNITNVTLSASPSTDTVPFTSTISFGADNTGDADATLIAYRSFVDEYTVAAEIGRITIPAGGSVSESIDVTFTNVGVYNIYFAGSSIQVTGKGEITDPDLTNIVLTVSPTSGTVPFDSSITFGADNTGGSPITAGLYIQSEKVDEITIPASSTDSKTITYKVIDEGDISVNFESEFEVITGNADATSYSGYIDIESAATDDTEGVQPDGTVDVIHTPSQGSDTCGTGGTEFNVKWKLTDYCMILPDGPDKATVAQAVSGSISSKVTGLGSTYPGLSPSGYPRIRVYSETYGTADNGESVTFGVPSALEQDGGVFSRYTVNLTGGVDEYIVNEQIDILIGGSVFATTAAIDNLETADSIAQKIYDACVAVGSGTYSFAKNGTRVLVGSTGGAETLDLDIKNAGFSYESKNITEV